MQIHHPNVFACSPRSLNSRETVYGNFIAHAYEVEIVSSVEERYLLAPPRRLSSLSKKRKICKLLL